jgi:hypothetical protein
MIFSVVRVVHSLSFQGSAMLTLVSSVLWFLVWSVFFKHYPENSRDWTTRTTLKIIGRTTQGSTQHYPENSRDWTTRTTLKIIGWTAVLSLVSSVLWFLVWSVLFNLSFHGSAVLTLVSSILWFLVWSVLFNLWVFRVVLCWPLCHPSYDF